MSAFQRLNVAPNPSNAVTPGSDIFPVGAIALWTTNTPPDDWLNCDGAAVSRQVYDDLFQVIGTTYGSGDASATFTGSTTPIGGNTQLVQFTGIPSVPTTWLAGKQFTATGGPASWAGGNYIFTITTSGVGTVTASATSAGFPVTFSSGTSAVAGTINMLVPSTFNVPNTGGRTIRGVGTAGSTTVTLAQSAGADTTSFTIAATNLPPHRHGVLVPGTAQFAGSNPGGFPNIDSGTRTIAGSTWLEDGTTPVANSAISVTTTNQYIGLNFIIRT